jgi:tRNA threonylcarbamoyladenosine biosynthesis protein TsaB
VRVLALDTALAACSVAVLDTNPEQVLARVSLPMERGHAEALMPMIDQALGGPGALQTVDRIVVTTGPGSFTGIRVGLSAARGLALATAKPLIGVTTLIALVAPALATGDGRAVAAAVDARHGRVFFQIFAPSGMGLVPARVLSAKDAARMAGEGAVRLVGSGAPMVLEASNVRHEIVPESFAPDPVWLARLGAAAPVPDRPPRPVYLRPPDVTKPTKPSPVARA